MVKIKPLIGLPSPLGSFMVAPIDSIYIAMTEPSY